MPLPLPIGTLLHGRYRIKGVLARGEFGLIYVAEDQKRADEPCTLEEFLPINVDAETLVQLRDYWQTEITSLIQLQHPQILRSRVVVADAQRLFLVQDDIVASPYREILTERLAAGTTFSEAEVEQFLVSLLPVLDYLHDRGLRHGNLCLDSILLQEPDAFPVLSNFGVVRTLAVECHFQSINPAWSNTWLATQSRRRHAPDEDLYDLATVALALLTGQESALEVDPNPLNSWRTGITPAFARLLKRMLLPQPQGRYTSARKVLQALQALRDEAAAESPIAPPEPGSIPDPIPGPIPDSMTRLPRSAIPARALSTRLPATDRAIAVPRSRHPDFSLPLLVAIFLGLGGLLTWKVVSLMSQPTATPTPTGVIAATSPPVQPPVQSKTQPSVQSKTQPTITAASAATDRPTETAGAVASGPNRPKMPAQLRDRAEQLGVRHDLFVALVDDLWALQQPDRGNRPLTEADAKPLQDQWHQLADSLLNRLAQLSTLARQDMGTYNRASYDRWLITAKLAVTRPKLEALADAQFLRQFPEFQSKPVNPRRFGQVWYAIVRDQITALQSSPKAGDRP